MHFIAHSGSFSQTNDQHWVPVCLPLFNPNGFLQAYICNLRIKSTSAVGATTLNASATSTTVIGIGASTQNEYADFTLVFIASASDSNVFKELHQARNMLENVSYTLLLVVDIDVLYSGFIATAKAVLL